MNGLDVYNDPRSELLSLASGMHRLPVGAGSGWREGRESSKVLWVAIMGGYETCAIAAATDSRRNETATAQVTPVLHYALGNSTMTTRHLGYDHYRTWLYD